MPVMSTTEARELTTNHIREIFKCKDAETLNTYQTIIKSLEIPFKFSLDDLHHLRLNSVGYTLEDKRNSHPNYGILNEDKDADEETKLHLRDSIIKRIMLAVFPEINNISPPNMYNLSILCKNTMELKQMRDVDVIIKFQYRYSICQDESLTIIQKLASLGLKILKTYSPNFIGIQPGNEHTYKTFTKEVTMERYSFAHVDLTITNFLMSSPKIVHRK
jgi:hypothetical protein